MSVTAPPAGGSPNAAVAAISPVGSFFELLGLCGLVIAQPVLNTFQGNATDLVFRRTSALDLVALGIVVIFLPPLVLWTIGRLTHATAGPVPARFVHSASCGLLVGLLVLELMKEATSAGPFVLVLMALFTGIAFTSFRWLSNDVGQVLRYLAIAPALFLAVFLFFSPVTEVAFADGTADAASLELGNPASVVVIVLDELPTLSLLDGDDQIDAELWPGFASLAEQSSWFRSNTSIAPTTPTAVPAIFTGRLPTDTKVVPVVDNHPQNLFTMFGATHELTVHESVTRLCPAALCGEAERNSSFRTLLSDSADVWWGFVSPNRSADDAEIDFNIPQSDPSADVKIDAWLDNLPTDGAQHLSVIHTVLPHQPWWRLPDGRRYNAPVVAEGLGARLSWEADLAPLFAQQRHLLQLQWTDRMLSNMIRVLKDKNQWDDSLVIVTADHGVSFLPGDPIRGLGNRNESRVMFTPMFVKEPGQTEGRIDERPTQTIDVVPTILDVLDAESPWPLDGRSMLGEPDSGPDIRTFTEWSLNTRDPDNGIYYDVDGAAAYAELLSLDPVVPAGDPAMRLWRWGAFGSLVGTPVTDQTIGQVSDLTLNIDQPDNRPSVSEALADFDADDRPPVYISGVVDDDANGPEQRLLIAVLNGTIVGWNQTKVVADDTRFWTLAWPEALVNGFNDLAVFEAVGMGDELVLRPVVLRG